MIEAIFAALLVATLCGWAFWIWRVSLATHNAMTTFSVMAKLNDEIDVRVAKRIAFINASPVPAATPSPAPAPGARRVPNAIDTMLGIEQPPAAVQMRHIVDEAAEIERELSRYRNPNGELSRENVMEV